MQAEILSVGTELLLGQIVNTNAAYLSRKLADLGIDVFRQVAVGDNHERIRAAVAEAATRADVIIITGGLGPTADDITAEAVASALGRDLIFDEASASHIRRLLESRGITVLESHLRQARLPAGARIMPNPIGTAPGFMVEHKLGDSPNYPDSSTALVGGPGQEASPLRHPPSPRLLGTRGYEGQGSCPTVFALPGVPGEMEAMAEESLWPELRRRVPAAVIRSRVLRFVGLGESSLEELISDLVRAQTNPTIAFLAQAGEVHLRLTANTADPAEADRLLNGLEAAVRERAGRFMYGRDEETLEAAVGRHLRAAGLTLGVAESCTGGLIGHRLTQVPGSSDYFLGSLVTYSDRAKIEILGVPKELLAEHGAVSAPVAIAMAQGARRALAADLAVSVTGIAGPGGGSERKPVGLTYIGVSRLDGEECQEYRLGGTREMVKSRAANAALALVLREAERLAATRVEE